MVLSHGSTMRRTWPSPPACGMVADTIDPPAMVEARHEIAETLGPSMLTPDEWEARLTARNRERDNHRIGCPDYDPPDAVNPYAKPYDDALAARERLRRHGLEKD